MQQSHCTRSSALGGAFDAGGNSLKPPFLKGLLHRSGAEAEPWGLGKGNSRATAEPTMFKGLSGLSLKPVLILDGLAKALHAALATAPANALCLERGWSWAARPSGQAAFGLSPPGVGRAMSPPPPGQTGPGRCDSDATVPRALLVWGFHRHCPCGSGAGRGSLQRGE